MRKVDVYKYVRKEGQSYSDKVLIGEGVFHKFGSAIEEYETGVGTYSTAIIEMPDGRVENPHVSLVVFKEPMT